MTGKTACAIVLERCDMKEIKSTRDYRTALHWLAYGLTVRIHLDSGEIATARTEDDIWQAKGEAKFVGIER